MKPALPFYQSETGAVIVYLMLNIALPPLQVIIYFVEITPPEELYSG